MKKRYAFNEEKGIFTFQLENKNKFSKGKSSLKIDLP